MADFWLKNGKKLTPQDACCLFIHSPQKFHVKWHPVYDERLMFYFSNEKDTHDFVKLYNNHTYEDTHICLLKHPSYEPDDLLSHTHLTLTGLDASYTRREISHILRIAPEFSHLIEASEDDNNRCMWIAVFNTWCGAYWAWKNLNGYLLDYRESNSKTLNINFLQNKDNQIATFCYKVTKKILGY